MKKYLSAQEFANATDEVRAASVVAKGYQIETKAEGDENTVTFIVSSDSVDRDGDIVYQAGIDWSHFQKNPVILWAHNSRDLPIAKGGNLRREGTKTLMDMTFAPAEANPKAPQVRDLIKGGFLNTVSIGFIPTEYSWVEDKSTGRRGLDIKRSEALEVSVVPVPSNRDALVTAYAKGLAVEPVEDEIRTILKGYELDENDKVVAKAPGDGGPPTTETSTETTTVTVSVSVNVGNETETETPGAPGAMTDAAPSFRQKLFRGLAKALGMSEQEADAAHAAPEPETKDPQDPPALSTEDIDSKMAELRARNARLKSAFVED
ncbi:HK97 family phage prohead protease [uncultured Alsobacter sp.]|uniref:HK97 family phage prohead protease n=1 Tax=uncultured Alsobacter sp. TaxID=1748258 RepID=UPI0025F5809F|nr:HK97 family phage prohead protease [uncultured Alsobacter sp.]